MAGSIVAHAGLAEAPGEVVRPAPLELRNATMSDATEALAIWNEGVPPVCSVPGSHEFSLTMDQMVEYISNHQKAMRPLWLASSGGTPAALLSFLGFHDRPWCHATSEIGIHVRHRLRGQGIGRRLLKHAIDAAPMLRFDRYVAAVRSDNAASLNLFRSLGFARWGRLPGVAQCADLRHDLLLFGRVVGKG